MIRQIAPSQTFTPTSPVENRYESQPSRLTLDLPLVLFAEAVILVLSCFVWWFANGLDQVMSGIAAVSIGSLLIIGWFAVRHIAEIECYGFLILKAALTYWYLVPMLLAGSRGEILLDGQHRDFTPDQIAKTCVAVMLTNFASTLVYQLVAAPPVLNLTRLSNWFNGRRYQAPLIAIGVQLALGLAPFLFSDRGLITTILGSRSAGGIFPKSNLGGSGGSAYALTFFLTSCCLLAFYGSLVRPGGLVKWTSLLFALAALLVSAFALSTRSMLLASVMPALTLYLLGSTDRWRFIKVGACLAGLWFGADLLVSTRDQGFVQSVDKHMRVSRNLVDNDYFSELVFEVATIPDQVRYSYEDPTVFALLAFIPRALWHSKPVQQQAEVVMRLRTNLLTEELTGNMLPGIAGQYWEEMGWPGLILLGVWLGGLSAVCDHLLVLCNWTVRYLVFTYLWALFISFRAFALSTFLPAALCAIAILLLSRPEHEDNAHRH